VTWGRDRDEAIARMSRALREFDVGGVPTTIPFHARVMETGTFQRGEATTAFLAEHPEVIPPPADVVVEPAEPAGAKREILVEVNNRRFTVSLPEGIALNGASSGGTRNASPVKRKAAGGKTSAATGPDLKSPIQGTVIRVAAEAGQEVAAGALICVIEAMKMENEVKAKANGILATVHVVEGATVEANGKLFTFA
jgi:acetyl-CoA/propionyl-CoA carboxylase biotin carboxyl carrier protein